MILFIYTSGQSMRIIHTVSVSLPTELLCIVLHCIVLISVISVNKYSDDDDGDDDDVLVMTIISTTFAACRSSSRCHAACVCPSSRLYHVSTAGCISLGGEGNALYPVLSSFSFSYSY